MDFDYKEILADLLEKGTYFGVRLVISLILVFIGFKISNYVTRLFNRFLTRIKVEISVAKFLTSLVRIAIKILIVISAAIYIGIPASTFIALIGSAGLAIGLALQGSLANFAGGILIITFKPFRVGDYVEGAGHAGKVEEIHILNTVMTTFDNKQVIIPNGTLSNSSIINYTINPTRRLDITFGVDYSADIDQVKDLLLNLAKNQEEVLEDPAPVVYFSAMADSSINFSLRVWVKVEDYWALNFRLLELAKKAFDEHKIGIPYPHMDVNLFPRGKEEA